jgi:hypothetical protein
MNAGQDMEYLSKFFKDIKNSGAFADEDQFEATRKIRRKKVVLVLTGDEQDTKSVMYAMNVSKRVEAGLDILCVTLADKCGELLEKHLKELTTNGTEYHVVKMNTSIHNEVIHYIEQSPDIEFVVIDSNDLHDDAHAAERYGIKEWKGLRCPLVLVS